MPMEAGEWLRWIAGIGVPLFIFLFAVWWRKEDKQEQELKDFKKKNDTAHKEIHRKMDDQHKSTTSRLIELFKSINGKK